MIDPSKATDALSADLGWVREKINGFTAETFQCRGGRIGSGMGLCLEGLWGFYARQALENRLPGSFQIAWLPEHEYNDFAVIHDPAIWKPGTKEGELFRIEVKAMNIDADESKGHFDALNHEIGESDQLLVVAWRWAVLADQLVYPRVIGEFLGDAREVAALRDALHLVRGGSFVDAQTCPDGCDLANCPHGGEPLNPRGTRERRSGPVRSITGTISHAANFGGLVRMIKVRGRDATACLEEQRELYPTRKRYVDFIRSFPTLREEL